MPLNEEEFDKMVEALLKNKKFKTALDDIVIEAVDAQLTNSGVDADNVNDLDSKIEEVINNGSFETTFSA